MTTEKTIAELKEKLRLISEHLIRQGGVIERQAHRITALETDHIAQTANFKALTKVCAIMLPLIETNTNAVTLALTKAIALATDATELSENDPEYQQAVAESIEQWRQVIADGRANRSSFSTTQPKPWLAHSQPPQALGADDEQQRKDEL